MWSLSQGSQSVSVLNNFSWAHMIAKKYRLGEMDIRKVLSRKKPFFSYSFIANTRKNPTGISRFAILLSGKVTPGSVNRNTFRRIFYDTACENRFDGYDVVIVPKKGMKLDHKNPEHRQDFVKNIRFLLKNIRSQK